MSGMPDGEIEKLVLELGALTTKQHLAAKDHGQKLELLLKTNMDEGIKQIYKIYKEALNDANTDDKGNYQGGYSAADPYEAVPWAIYNAVGSVYPNLIREQKDAALRQIFGILDGINYLIVQTVHTPGIKEPLLVADITLTNILYWPGLDESRHLVVDYDDFSDIRRNFIDDNGMFNEKINSDFVVAYSLLRSDFSDFAEQYLQVANPKFLERVLRAIVWMRFAPAINQQEIQDGKKRLEELLPESLHDKIEPLRLEGGWVDRTKFRGH